MAGTIKGISVSLGGDTVDLQKSLTSINSSSKTLQSELTQINKQLKFDPQNSVLLAQKQEVLAENIETTKAKLNQLMSVQDQVEKQAASGEIGQDKYRAFQREVETTKSKLKNLESQLEDTKRATAEVENQSEKVDMSGFQKELNDSKTAIKDFETKGNKLDLSEFQNEVDDAKNAVSNLKDTTTDTFKKLGAGVAAGGAAVVGAVKSFDSVESALNSIQAQTGASDEQMQSYRDTLETIYKGNYGESLEEVANVIALVTQFTNETDTSKIQDIAQNAFTLRDTFDYDFAESLRAVKMLMEQFGISSEQAFNLIVQGSQKGLNKNGDLLDTINEYSVHYRQLGYTAEGFFNSLTNGTEAGTFSVDKLGDAMKEFGIRVKDTATSTTEGFTLLGYGASDSEEAISEVKDEISKLEKNLKYAKMEQDNFNESTSELTKLKNADKIKEYSSQLETAKQKLNTLTSETGSSLGSIEDLQAKFAEGGEAAQEATQEVLTALFNMDDKVKQNQAGVDLFGTMWEDLGLDGVKALMNVSGAADKTIKSMEEINDIQYDDVTNDISSLGRKIQTEIVNKLIEKYYPKIKDGIEWVSENLDDLIPIISGVAKEIAVLYGAKKANDFANAVMEVVKTFRTLKSVTDSATAAQKMLNLAQNSNVIGLVIGAVGTLITVFTTLNSVMGENNTKTDSATEKQQELVDKLNEQKQKWQEVKDAREKAASEVSSEFQYYTDLKNELDQIVTKNGEIKRGYEDRANFIANTLSEALGIDVNLTGKTLTNYQEISKELDKIIAKKKAEATLGAFEDDYNEAKKNIYGLSKAYTEQKESFENASKTYEKTQKELANAEQELDKLSSSKKIKNNNPTAPGEVNRQAELEQRISKLQKDLADQENDKVDAEDKLEQAQIEWLETQNLLSRYEELNSALMSGTQEEIDNAMRNLSNNLLTSDNATKEMLQNQLTTYQQNYENLKKALQEGQPGVTKVMVTEAASMVEKAKMELDKLEEAGDSGVKGLEKGVTSHSDELEEKGKEPAASVKKGMESVEMDVAPAWMRSAETSIDNNKDTLKTAVKDAAEYGKTGAENVSFHSVGWNFIQGLVNGISNGWENLKNGVKNVASNIVNGIKDFLGIHSPSTVAEKEIGYNFDLGIEKGLNKGKERIKKKSQQLAGTLSDTFQKDLQNKSKEIKKSGIDLSADYNLHISDINKEKINAAQNKIRNIIDTMNSKQSNINFSKIFTNIPTLKQPKISNNPSKKIVNNSPIINITANAEIHNDTDIKKFANVLSQEFAKEIQRNDSIWG